MVTVRLSKHQTRTRQLTGIALVVVMVFCWTIMFVSMSSSSSDQRPMVQNPTSSSSSSLLPPLKVLYIVTSSNEFNTGDKKTAKGQDRFMEILLPVVVDGVASMTNQQHYEVDVVLLLGYTLSEERTKLLQNMLSEFGGGAGLQVWNEATPLNYEFRSRTDRQVFLQEMPRALARQHRYVIKDKLPYYDYFLAFEDDMLLTRAHIDYHREFMANIETWKNEARNVRRSRAEIDENDETTKIAHGHDHSKWWEPLTEEQLDRIKPGLLRVEVLTDPNHKTQSDEGPILPNSRARPDPRVCCHADRVGLQGKLAPQYPTADQLLIWETALPALFVRQFSATTAKTKNDNIHSHGQWMAILPIKGMPNKIDGYWSGTDGALGPEYVQKPRSALNHFIGQSAGWMASQKEILDLDQHLCKGQFLPPFSEPYVQEDGMGFMTDSVEYWSGGLQLWGQQCEIQRVVALDPKRFSRHLIYHTANNKQKEIDKERLVKVSTLLGQLHTVKHAAEAVMNRELGNEWIFVRLLRRIGLVS